MPRVSEPGPRDRILGAAEHAFAENGFEGASLRDIVREAQVNLAMVYYYFQSKNGLVEAVLKRRFGPLRGEHLDLLRDFEREAGSCPLLVEKILEAMLLPALRLAAAEPAKRHAVTRLIGRVVTEPNPQIQLILRSQRAEVQAAFLKAMQAALPEISEPELERRIEFVWGALSSILCNPQRLQLQTRGADKPWDAQTVMAEMIRFFAPGFRAPGTSVRASAVPDYKAIS